MGLLSGLFGQKVPLRSPRDILADAIADVGDPSLVPVALTLFDDPSQLIEQWEGEQGEPPEWADPERPQSAAELAYQVFEHVLREDQRIGFLDWADGWMCVEREFNMMFRRLGAPPVDDTERAHMERATENCERGKTTQILWNFMHDMGRRRGLQLDWIQSDGDCHFPMYIRREAYEKWRRARFGKGVDVLP